MHKLKVKCPDGNTMAAKITIGGVSVPTKKLTITLTPHSEVVGVAEIYMCDLDFEEVDARLECQVAGKRMVLVDPEKFRGKKYPPEIAAELQRILEL